MWVHVWRCLMCSVPLTSLTVIKLKKIIDYLSMFVSRDSLSVFAVRRLKPSITLIAAGCSRSTPVNQRHTSNGCGRPVRPHSESRTSTGSPETELRCSDSLFAPAWPSCVCCVWWVSDHSVGEHGSPSARSDVISCVLKTRFFQLLFFCPTVRSV